LVEWKRFGQSEAEYELYDYDADPAETTNRAAERPELVKTLAAELTKHPPAKPQIRNAEAANAAPKKKSGGKQDRNALFARKDKDGDGKLTKDEFLANQPDPDKAPARFSSWDVDRDGFLSKDEFVHQGKKR
jgi:iduronate 2-sulfatase